MPKPLGSRGRGVTQYGMSQSGGVSMSAGRLPRPDFSPSGGQMCGSSGLTPNWHQSATFGREKPKQPIARIMYGTEAAPMEQQSIHETTSANIAHQEEEEDDAEEYCCDLCGFKTWQEEAIWLHLGQRHPDKVDSLSCNNCNFKTVDPGHLKSHRIRCIARVR